MYKIAHRLFIISILIIVLLFPVQLVDLGFGQLLFSRFVPTLVKQIYQSKRNYLYNQMMYYSPED
jgi:hypothetical protein